MKKLFLLSLGLIGTAGYSQSIERSVTAASGNYLFKAGTGSLSFTLGENAVTTLISTNNVLTQGFQQSDTSKISFVTEKDMPVTMIIYPNPVSYFLTCKINNEQHCSFTIYDVAGRKIEVPVLTNENETVIDVHSLLSGTYMLSVFDIQRKLNITKKFIKQ